MRKAALALCALACGAGLVAAGPAGETACGYTVSAGPEARELAVEAHFSGGVDQLVVDDGLGAFLRDAELELERGDWRPLERDGDRLLVPGCAERPCRLRYRFLLERAARELRDRGRSFEHQGAFLAPPSSWLARPLRSLGRCRFEVKTPPGIGFVSGVFPASAAGGNTYELGMEDLPQSPYSGFGPFETSRIEVPGGVVEVAVSPGELTVSRAALLGWVEASARSVASYYGRFPVPRVLVIVLAGGRRPVGFGTTLGHGGASIMVRVGRAATEADLANDWVLTHEMVHLGVPNLRYAHRWLEEGIATYVEPIARARAGHVAPERVWRGLLEGLPKGLPRPGDLGLDRTRTWGRIYWGGALFSFLADLEIRERTRNARSFEDALRGIVAAGGSIAVRWDLDRLLEAADGAVGFPVLRDLHARMGAQPMDVDLEAVWSRLGVLSRDGSVVFDDRAPLAPIRQAFTRPGGRAFTPRP